MGKRYDTRDEAIEREIVEPIEASGIVEDARAECDVEAIAREVLDAAPGPGGYYWTNAADHDTFWQSVARHEQKEH